MSTSMKTLRSAPALPVTCQTNPLHPLCLIVIAAALCLNGPRPASAETFVCGTIVGETWTKAGAPYVVTCDILVAGLTIEPGVQVLFSGNFVFEVGGVLTALGTEEMPIAFTRTNGGWQGIFFNNSPPGSELRHCMISDSINRGVRIVNSTPVFRDCWFVNNSGTGNGGGVNASVASGDLLFEDCHFINNGSTAHGGGIAAVMSGGTLRMRGCQILTNWANPSIADGNFVGGGVYVAGGFELLSSAKTNSVISRNTSYSKCTSQLGCSVLGRAGGIYISSGNSRIENCRFQGNSVRADNAGNCNFQVPSSSDAFGSGIYLNAGTLTVRNSIFTQNSLGASICERLERGSCVYVGGGTCRIENVTCAYNNDGQAIYRNGGTVTVTNSIVYFNAGGQIGGTVTAAYSDIQGGFAGTGNTDVHPLFNNTNDLMIVSLSPCVDAGDPNPIFNDECFPPSWPTARNDMGAHGGPGACITGEAPAITQQPRNQATCLGRSVMLCVSATGAPPLSYHWRFHGANCQDSGMLIPDATNACHAIASAQSADAGFYSVIVTNAFGVTNSACAELSVAPACLAIDLYPGLTVGGQIGQTYCIQYTTNLTGAPTWIPLTNVTLNTLEYFFLDPQPARYCENMLVAPPHRFYRVVEGPCP